MKKKILLLAMGIFFVLAGMHAQTSCTDMNGYVNYKNTGGTGYYTLNAGYEEKAAQTYHYSGPGKISSVRLYGSGVVGIPIRVGIYNVDNTGRPTSLISYTDTSWRWFANTHGYMDVYFANSGVTVSKNFAVEVELRSGFPLGNSLKLKYTGDGEGRGEDLASLAGTSTGGNWSSAKNVFNKDGDFYLVPNMSNFITSDFHANVVCIPANSAVDFTNTSLVTRDSMFNLIGWKSAAAFHYYEWNFGDASAVSNAVSPSHTFTTPGIYTVSLKTTLVGWSDTCSDIKTMQISVGLTSNTTSLVNATCNGSANGSAVAVGAGGSGHYTYSINNGEYGSSTNFTGLGAASYTLHVADELGCVSNTVFVITEPSPIIFSGTSSTNASCGNADGSILVSATGGVGSLQYKLNTGSYQSTGSFTNKASGSYLITVADANGCSQEEMVAVNNVGGPFLTLFSMTNVSCNGASDGSILVLGSGGSGVLQYSINGGTSFQTSGSFAGQPAGNYAVMVKDAVGCSQLIEVSITQPSALIMSASSTATGCYGGEDGRLTVTSASGGTGSFTYSIDGINYQSYPQFTGLSAGPYTAYIKDAAGCTKSTDLAVAQPTPVAATLSFANASCYLSSDGSINVVASGGSSGYSFSLDGENYQPTGNFDNLYVGQYTVTVLDAHQCSATAGTTINQPTAVTASVNTTASTCGNSNGGLLAAASGGSGTGYLYALSSSVSNSTGLFDSLSSGTYYLIIADGAGCGNFMQVNIADANGPVITGTSHTNVACNEGSDGSITVNTVSGGTGTLQYSLNGTDWQTATQFTRLGAGTFVVTVKDANGCTGTAFDTLTQPNAFTITTTPTNLTCYANNSGSTVVLASGGAGVFAYSVDGGATYQASNTFDGLGAGKQTVIVRDAAGCLGSASFVLTQPTQLVLTAGVLNVTCDGAANGAIILNSSGGTGAHTYSLGETGFQTLNIFTGLSGGYYTTWVKDANGCTASLLSGVFEPAPIVTIPTISQVSCAGGNNGTIAIEVNGGTAPYGFKWSDEINNQDRFNLVAGTYSVTVRDDHGCTQSSTFEITQPANPLVVNGVVVNSATTTSNDGSVSLTVTGGNEPYSYSWSNNANSQNISGLAPGSYSINIKDANGCIVSGVFVVSSTTAIAQVSASNAAMTIYPNPSAANTTVEVPGYTIISLKVINAAGQLVFETEPKQPKVEIQTSELASGIYFVEVLVSDGLITKRMIVSK